MSILDRIRLFKTFTPNKVKDYLKLKDDLDLLSLKISILTNKINGFKSECQTSFDNISKLQKKIDICLEKPNVSLAKFAFSKLLQEEYIYNHLKNREIILMEKANILTSHLVDLQNIYRNMEDSVLSKNFSPLKNSFLKKESKIYSLLDDIYKNFPTSYVDALKIDNLDELFNEFLEKK